VIINKAFITSIVALLSIRATLYLLKNEGELFLNGLKTLSYQYILFGLFVIFLYSGLLLELVHQLSFFIESNAFREVVVGSYNLLFIIGCLVAASISKSGKLSTAATLLGIFGMVVFLIHYHPTIIQLRHGYLVSGNVTFAAFLYHYILIALVAVLVYLTFRNIRSLFGLESSIGKLYLWIVAFVVIFMASAELDHLIVLNQWQPETGKYTAIAISHKIGYPILWGISSFILMILGMKHNMKTLRIISLTLFFITLSKLFLFDIRGISEGGKIAAFVSLGILLLIVSFMYQKLKNLILEGGVKTPGP
jgi:uncharacterized membrane protein